MMVIVSNETNNISRSNMNSKATNTIDESFGRDSHQILLGKIRSGLYKISNKRRGRSEVWNIFGEIQRDDGTFVPRVVFCRNCHGILSFNGKQTSNLNRHKCYTARKEFAMAELQQELQEQQQQSMKSEVAESSGEENNGGDYEIDIEPKIKLSRSADLHISKPFTILSRNSTNSTTGEQQQLQQPSIEVNAETTRLDDPRVNAAYDILKATVAKNDDCAIFGDHVAHKIRQYSSRTRSIVQHHINNIIFEADIGKYDNENDSINSNSISDDQCMQTTPENNSKFIYSNQGNYSIKSNKNKNNK